MTISARNFPGGAATDALVSTSTLTLASKFSFGCRLKLTGTDATARRLVEHSDITTGNNIQFEILINSSNLFFNAIAFSTSFGSWTIVLPSTGAEHDLLWTYDPSNVANNPVCYLDGSSVTVTRVTAPVGSWSPTARTLAIGNANSLDRCFNGWISTVGLWSDVLSAADATSFHAGIAPCAIESQILQFYAPLDNGDSPEPDTVSSNNLTVSGTTVVTGSSVLVNPRCTPIPFPTPIGYGRPIIYKKTFPRSQPEPAAWMQFVVNPQAGPTVAQFTPAVIGTSFRTPARQAMDVRLLRWEPRKFGIPFDPALLQAAFTELTNSYVTPRGVRLDPRLVQFDQSTTFAWLQFGIDITPFTGAYAQQAQAFRTTPGRTMDVRLQQWDAGTAWMDRVTEPAQVPFTAASYSQLANSARTLPARTFDPRINQSTIGEVGWMPHTSPPATHRTLRMLPLMGMGY